MSLEGVRYCKACNYAMDEEAIEQARSDYECPSCGRCNISRFYSAGSQVHREILRGIRKQPFRTLRPPIFPATQPEERDLL